MSSNMQPQYLAFVTAFLQTDLLLIEGYVKRWLCSTDARMI